MSVGGRQERIWGHLLVDGEDDREQTESCAVTTFKHAESLYPELCIMFVSVS